MNPRTAEKLGNHLLAISRIEEYDIAVNAIEFIEADCPEKIVARTTLLDRGMSAGEYVTTRRLWWAVNTNKEKK